ncbi:M24 family metallopeptidase [Paraclostridium bifermentans]|jgi:Xaa-Pro dipeptidase|uniref:M24 family metallopeptidase n=1 Tax=Paraclostridium bifermentans TaxID=1490 RepID=UPI000DF7E3BE|nr:Xaa-Pro peptidase family protein [Paraclostridium bifermentans]RDC49228.1 aminopeptidase P family protein [Acinetobacter sp. RIT592]MBS6508910.1 aminopeptidase P family protein [Paraclostridium bifermentans]MBU5286832.1 Xaa-Pro peptidase family protein [Paraclostridium bifermentans]MDU3336528.1 Xaa-Pro peptidase family protein [Paraclostridium bifermentans]MDU3804251.1 Xaa-Pro peptidase family protein [Paraclostridium bifermentans]
MKTQRLNAVLDQMKKNSIDQMLISDPYAIFYLTGKMIHPGERLLALYINVNGNNKMFINELFPVTEDLGVEMVWFNDTQNSVEIVSNGIDKNGTIGVDKNWPAKFLLALMDLCPGCKFVNSSYIVDTLRSSKDEEEKDLMRKASALNDEAMKRLKNTINADLTEKQLANKLSGIYEDLGADGFSFSPIIGFGPTGADPHGTPGDRKVKAGDAIILDIGCVKDNYCSDMTRTVFYKEAPEKAKEVFEIVLEANKRAIALVKPGVRFCDIDAAARDYITEKGYGKYFTHRTGHSIGLECHDMGDVSSVNTDCVQEGMIFSVEPGIYLPGEFGVRIEDLVLVTKDGHENLNKHDKELVIVG